MKTRRRFVQTAMTTGDDDRILVEQALAGSHRAADRLFRRHWRTVWQAAYAVTGRASLADDVAQDAFVRAFQALEQFDAERPLEPWLKRIAVNRAIDELRRERHLRPVGAAEVEAAAEDRPERYTEAVSAVNGLDSAKRVVVVMHFWLGYSLEQTAEVLGVPVGTVASRLSRGLAELRSHLEVDRDDSTREAPAGVEEAPARAVAPGD